VCDVADFVHGRHVVVNVTDRGDIDHPPTRNCVGVHGAQYVVRRGDSVRGDQFVDVCPPQRNVVLSAWHDEAIARDALKTLEVFECSARQLRLQSDGGDDDLLFESMRLASARRVFIALPPMRIELDPMVKLSLVISKPPIDRRLRHHASSALGLSFHNPRARVNCTCFQ
jgi:hypothetical protein